MADITVSYGLPIAAQLDPGQAATSGQANQFRDSIDFLQQWMGGSYLAGAVVDHNHDGVNSAKLAIGPNLVRNGGFEDGDNNWTYTPYTGGSIARVTSAHASGQTALAITLTSVANGGGDALSNEYIAVVGGDLVPIMARYWATAAGISSRLRVYWYDKTQTQISYTDIMTSADTPTAATLASDSVAAPATARYCRLELVGGVPGSGTATGTVYWDAVILNMTLASNLIQRRMLRKATANNPIPSMDLPAYSSSGTMPTTIGSGRPARGGTYQIRALLSTDDGNYTANYRLLINGNPTSPIFSSSTTGEWKGFSFSCDAGDKIDFQIYSAGSGIGVHCLRATLDEDEPIADFGVFYG